jgi:WD repeat-containing protein 23
MADPWSAMGDEDDETFSGPDAYLDDDDEQLDLDFEIEDEVEELGEEAEMFQTFMDRQSTSFRLGAETETELNISELSTTQNTPEIVDQREHLERLLATIPVARLTRIFASRADDNDDDDDDHWGEQTQSQCDLFKKITEPQPAGVKLLMSGEFGRIRNRLDSQQNGNMFDRLRRTAVRSRHIYREDLIHDLVPNTHGTAVASYIANVYCGQYSAG